MNKLTLTILLGLLCTISYAAVDNCKTLDADDDTDLTCEVCNDGYGLEDDGAKCTECSVDNCALCPTAPATCAACKDGFGEDGAKCTACSVTNCALCPTAPGTCAACKDGYGKDGAKCTACADTNCKTCTLDKDTCTGCKSGFTGYNDDAEELDECTACANGCAECATVGASCASCPTGQEKNNTNKENVFCCPANCSTCSSTSVCLTCKTGSSLNDVNACVFGFKTGASLTLGAVVSVAILSLLF